MLGGYVDAASRVRLLENRSIGWKSADMHLGVLMSPENDKGFPPSSSPQSQNKSLVGNQILLFAVCVSCSPPPSNNFKISAQMQPVQLHQNTA
jgi:hypothetical protein